MATPSDDTRADPFGTCPVPTSDYDRILLGHGSGGRLTADLIQRLFVPGFGNDVLAALEDQATVPIDCRLEIADRRLKNESGAQRPQFAIANLQSAMRVAFTTDSFVVRPLF